MNKNKSFKKNTDDKFVQQYLYIEDFALFENPKKIEKSKEDNDDRANLIIIDIL